MKAVAAPAMPRQRAVTGTRRARGVGQRWRAVADKTRWYVVKWFRQMVYVLSHPEDAFWDLKRTGDWLAVPFLLLCTILARMTLMQFMGFHYVFQGVERTNWTFERFMNQFTSTFTIGMTSFFYSGNPEDTSILQEGVRIIIPFATWVLAHYAIAMIFYGEGTLKNVAVAAAFSLTPFILFSWPASLVLTNVTTLAERTMYLSISWIIQLWVIYLFFVHIRVIHDFTVKRTMATYAVGLISVLIIWALLALVYALSLNTYEFLYGIFYEFTTR
jgi:hypothetical protein